jgi:hypothetical protein
MAAPSACEDAGASRNQKTAAAHQQRPALKTKGKDDKRSPIDRPEWQISSGWEVKKDLRTIH